MEHIITMTRLFDFDYPNVWTALEESSLPIVLYGMGNGADKVLGEFERLLMKLVR